MTAHSRAPDSPPVVYVSDPNPGEVYLNIGNHQSFGRHKLTEGEVDKLLVQLLNAKIRWPRNGEYGDRTEPLQALG